MIDVQQILTSLDSLAKIQDNQRIHVLPTGALRIDPANWTQFLRRSWNADCRSRTVAAIQNLVQSQITRARSEAQVVTEMRGVELGPALAEDLARRQAQLCQLCTALADANQGVQKLVLTTYKNDEEVCVALGGVGDDINILLTDMHARGISAKASVSDTASRPDSPT